MRTTRTSLGTLIAAVITTSLGCGGSTQSDASGTGARADGGTGGDAGVTPDAGQGSDGGVPPGFTPMDCARASSVASVTTQPPLDYVELREEVGSPGDPTDKLIEKRGTLCAGASDVAACKTKFEAIQHPFQVMCSVPYCNFPRYLAYTRGNEVGTVEPGQALAKFAAPIDSIDEAAFFLDWATPYTCAGSGYRPSGDGFDFSYTYADECPSASAGTRHAVIVHVARDGGITVLEDVTTPPPPSPTGCAAARRAQGAVLDVPPARDRDTWLEGAAQLEAASVGAFARLGRELARAGAPRALVRRVASAARDERGHARLLRRARARSFPMPRTARTARPTRAVRSLFAVALENAIEGSTRETWGAVVAAHQARMAPGALRAPFTTIAADELRHAELAADVGAWLDTQLTEVEKRTVEAARVDALAALEREVLAENAGDDDGGAARRALGLPPAPVMRALFANARAAGIFG